MLLLTLIEVPPKSFVSNFGGALQFVTRRIEYKHINIKFLLVYKVVVCIFAVFCKVIFNKAKYANIKKYIKTGVA